MSIHFVVVLLLAAGAFVVLDAVNGLAKVEGEKGPIGVPNIEG